MTDDTDQAVEAVESDATPESEAEAIETEAQEEGHEPELDENGDPIADAAAEADEDLTDYDHKGKSLKVPKELVEGSLRQADYTRKTQALSEERKAVEARAAVIQENAADIAKLGAADHQIQEWAKWIQDNPDQATAADFVKLQTLQRDRGQIAHALQQRHQQAQAEAQREDAKALEDMRASLAKEITGYSPAVEQKIFTFATRDLGFAPEDIAAVRDPRYVKVLHLAMSGKTANAKQSATAAVQKQQATSPAPTVAGRKAPITGLSDRLSTEEWARRRNEQLRKRNG